MKEWMELVDYKITEGSEYYANEKTLYSLSSWNGKHDGYSFNIVFDPREDHLVYTVEVCDYKNSRAYRRKIADYPYDSEEAWDGVNFIELETDDDFMQKAMAIKNGEDYDTRVVIPIDLPDELCYQLMKMAHERDMTFNDFVCMVTEEYATEILSKRENEK